MGVPCSISRETSTGSDTRLLGLPQPKRSWTYSRMLRMYKDHILDVCPFIWDNDIKQTVNKEINIQKKKRTPPKDIP